MHVPCIEAWLEEWAAIWRTGDLTGRVQIEPGRRLRRSLGRCHPTSGQVRIHPALFEPENAELLREVVCHEAAHAAVHLLHGRKVRPHGPEWKHLMISAGYASKARMDPNRLPPWLRTAMQPDVLYRHSCAVCGATRMAGRRVSRWRCRACRDAGLEGQLQIVRVG